MEPSEVEYALSTQSPLLKEKLRDDEKQGYPEFHSEQQEHFSVMTDPRMFDLDNMDETLRKRWILKGANQPKSADVPQKVFPKSKHGSHFRSFNDSWYHAKVDNETVHRNWISYSPSKDDFRFCLFCMFFGKGNKEKVFTRTEQS